MIIVTGDIHGNIREISKHLFYYERKRLEPDLELETYRNTDYRNEDFLIICGDFGLIWSQEETAEENFNLYVLEKCNYTILFCDGNHENFNRLYEFPEVDFMGGKAHQIRSNIYHLMRGNIYDILGKSFFVFGGASSHDIQDGILDEKDFKTKKEFKKKIKTMNALGKMFRIRNVSWWDAELPSEEEMNLGIRNLESRDYKVDYVIAHCLPQFAASIYSHGYFKPDILTMYFNKLIDSGLEFDRWYCGHYHTDQVIMGKFEILYGSFRKCI